VTLTFFWIFGVLAMLSALLCITRKNPVACALWLVVTPVRAGRAVRAARRAVHRGAAGAGLRRRDHGAVLFVIMLLNLGRPAPTDIKGPVGLLIAAVLAGMLLFQLRVVSQATLPDAIRLPPGTVAAIQQQQGMVGAVANPLFDAYLVPFEIASVLLLAAIVGAVVLAKRKL